MPTPSYASEPQIQLLHRLLAEIAEGQLEVPRFERPLVWTAEQMLELLRSVRSGIPIGSILVWRTTRQDIRTSENLGPHRIASAHAPVRTYLLDGLQRLSTLFAALNPRKDDENEYLSGDTPWNFYFRLDDSDFLLSDRREEDPACLPLWLLLDSVRLIQFQRRLEGPRAIEYIRAADELAKSVWSYKLPIIPLSTDSLEEATRVFQRINSQGTPMSEVHMLAALTHRERFDLREHIASVQQRLAEVAWHTASEELIVATCKAALGLGGNAADVDRTAVALLGHPEVFETVAENLTSVARLLSARCGIRSPRLVPADRQIVLLAEYLRLQATPLEDHETRRLASWVWLTSYFPASHLATMADGLDELRSTVETLNSAWVRDLGSQMEPLPQHFDFRTSRGRVLAVRLAEKEPRSPRGERLDALTLLGAEGERALLPLWTSGTLPIRFVDSPGNYFVVQAKDAEQMRRLLLVDCIRADPEFLRSHFISEEAAEALRQHDPVRFIITRKRDLDVAEHEFVSKLLLDMQRWLPTPRHSHPTKRQAIATKAQFPLELAPFFQEYLGTEEFPAPFGGREVELNRLTQWLLDFSSPPYAVLVAEAGSGKSALLARFAERVRSEGLADVAFVPISIRFGSAQRAAALRLLTSQVRRLQPESRRIQPFSLEIEALRIEAGEALTSEAPGAVPLLVVFDGLDEAVGWSPVKELPWPRLPGRGVKVLISARKMASRDWLGELGLVGEGQTISLHLSALSETDVLAILKATSPGTLADFPEAARLFHRLSEGAPLLLRLYIELLTAKIRIGAPVNLAEVSQWQPGLDSYFERYFYDQQQVWAKNPLLRESNEHVLAIFACALGPLLVDDLRALLSIEERPYLQQALAQVGRLVIGDGLIHGLVLCHPRLRDYLDARLTAAVKKRTRDGLIAFCALQLRRADSNEPSDSVSPYAVRHYGAHLEESCAEPEAFYALLSVEWLRAWHRLDASYDGFLGDIARAWLAADRDGAVPERRGHAVEVQIRAALLATSIQGLASNLPGPFLVALIRQKIWSPACALAHVRAIPEANGRGHALSALAPDLSGLLLDEAFAMARELKNGIDRQLALSAFLPFLSEGAQRLCLDELLAETDSRGGWWALRVQLAALPSSLIARSLAVAREVSAPNHRAERLVDLLPHLSVNERALTANEVLNATAELPPLLRAGKLIDLAIAEQGSMRSEVLTRAWHALQSEGLFERDTAAMLARLIEFLPYFPESTQNEILSHARRLAGLPDDERPDSPLTYLAVPLTRHGYGAEVLQLISKLHWAFRRLDLHRQVARYIDGDLRRDVLDQIHAYPGSWDRARSLVAVAASAPEEERLSMLEDAIDIPGDSGVPVVIVGSLLSSIVPYLRGRLLAKVISAVRQLTDTGRRSSSLATLLPCLEGTERQRLLEEILGALATLPRDRGWNILLVQLVPYLSRDQIQFALDIAYQLADQSNQVTALLNFSEELAKRQEPEGSMQVLSEAAQHALVPSSELWVRALEVLPQPAPLAVVIEARKAIDSLADHQSRSRGLSWLIPYLPEKARRELVDFSVATFRSLLTSDQSVLGLIKLVPFQQQASIVNYVHDLVELINSSCFRCDGIRNDLFALLYAELSKMNAPDSICDEVWSYICNTEDDSSPRFVFRFAACIALRHIPQALSWTYGINSYSGEWRSLLLRLAKLGQIDEALHQIRSSARPDQIKCETLTGLLPFLSRSRRTPIVREIKELLLNVNSIGARALVQTELIEHLPKKEQSRALSKVLALLPDISRDDNRAAVVERLAPHLAGLPAEELFAAWSLLLRTLGTGTRQELLGHLGHLAPVLSMLGGSELVTKAAQAVLAVGAWLR